MSQHHKGRCSVFAYDQNTAREIPRHHATRAVAFLVVSLSAARWLDESRTALQLFKGVTWASIKARVRSGTLNGNVGLNLPQSWYSFVTAYPPIPRESGGRRKQSQLWAKAAAQMAASKQL